VPLYHFDFCRIGSRTELLRLGIDDYLFGDGVCVVEWADRFPDLMPENSTWISIHTRESGERVIEVTARQ
jgi:tRNA threonylcarbamoyladenosine biosynthesis protein TsaE